MDKLAGQIKEKDKLREFVDVVSDQIAICCKTNQDFWFNLGMADEASPRGYRVDIMLAHARIYFASVRNLYQLLLPWMASEPVLKEGDEDECGLLSNLTPASPLRLLHQKHSKTAPSLDIIKPAMVEVDSHQEWFGRLLILAHTKGFLPTETVGRIKGQEIIPGAFRSGAGN